jgi:NRAMP (natural resistance-associated macrophage protein)-like metal ion transporter
VKKRLFRLPRNSRSQVNKLKRFLHIIGPGFITGAADDDPSGIATYAQTGAMFGYQQLWMALFSFPFMTVIQEMCGRIGVVTGKGLAQVIKEHYSKKILYVAVFILFLANAVNVGADLGVMASSGQLLIGIPFWWLLGGMTVISLLLELFIPYRTYANLLKYLTLSLLAYIVAAFVVHQDWTQIALATLIPSFSFDQSYLMNIVALLGTTISPYLFFWQTDEEVEELHESHIKANKNGLMPVTKRSIFDMRLDTTFGMLFSNVITFFIIITTASTLHTHGIFSIETADQAALALRPIAGEFAFVLFAAGIIGTGMLAVPVLAGSAAYAISETLGWKAGLNKKFHQAPLFYGLITFTTLVGVLVNLLPIKPFQLLYYTAVLNGISAPPLMLIIWFITNNKKIMGKHTNSLFTNFLSLLIIGLMSAASAAMFWSLRP